MADDKSEQGPYEILGIGRDADKDAIRKAYRRLAKESHPDLHPGDPAAEERFKRISGANALLSDPETRARYDRGEIDGSGQEKPPPRPNYREQAQGAQGRRYRAGPGAGASTSGAGPGDWGDEDLGDIFGDLFGRGGGRAQPPRGPRRGEDHSYSLTVSFADAVTGATTRITLPTGATLDVKVPPGIEDGQTLRLRGKGGEGQEGATAGDALIRIQITPDPRFTRDGNDIRVELPVSLKEAVLGGSVQIPTPAGPVAMTVPPDSDTGRTLRLRGRGIAAHGGREAGNLYVTLRVVLGRTDEALKAFLRDWSPKTPDTDSAGAAS
ncbi:DnaJ domain-containing protein [Lichenicola cladoniae]|uniref:DnaJ domain-containing protein n=1 Tax=Lichenicola cladoniae TaxID=1484109 RepID=A0A6M8HQR0_9PROT|nr:DnaJ C-terminal domain-containing protein [Lichenicola cladoniae]NPD68763.1 DnaJ domain-containing protein [Acetobacteraceae bacterium]QKE90813.1 DnaJ domain-containing protein [Lichenicola cladoniae]